ncbi:dihydropteroate synthase [Bacteroidia bacterium]|nr:dihydropteroate synthase [Bacteroidia bacterium]
MKNPSQLTLASPVVMTIINVTPDSFYGESRTMERDSIRRRIALAVSEGATILDIGGYSSRPGADDVSPREEIARISMAMEVVKENFDGVFVSIDTFRAEVAEAIVARFGPCIINDISAGELDPPIVGVAARYDLPYIAMHMRGTPGTMQQLTDYKDITAEVVAFFEAKIAHLRSRGVERIILDPGFGFAKTVEQNYQLLKDMSALQRFGYPILAGVSRKSMIYKALNITPEEALAGTIALGWEALREGASILRVHDTLPAAQSIDLFKRMYI